MSEQENAVTIDVPSDQAVPAVVDEELGLSVAAAEPVVTADEGIDSLKVQLAEMKASQEREAKAREAAEARASRVEADASRLRETSGRVEQDLRLQSINTEMERQSREAEKASEEYKTAFSTGNMDVMLEAQRKIARAEANLRMLEVNKEGYEAYAASRVAEGRVVAPTPSDPVEAVAATLTPRSAEWVRRHRDYITNDRLRAKLAWAHADAIAEGHAGDSDEYFTYIESMMGEGGPTLASQQRSEPVGNDPMSSAAPASMPTRQAVRTAPAMAAPVSHAQPSMTSKPTSPTRVTLTASQIEAAEMAGITPEAYARHLLKARREGMMN